MDHIVLGAPVVGKLAFEALQEATHGRVSGITANGVFLSINTGRVLFLSFTSWRGPLTLNLTSLAKDDFHVHLHSPLLIQEGVIYFSNEHITIEFERTELWSPPSRPLEMLPEIERAQRLARVSTTVTAALADRLESGGDALSKLETLFDPGSLEFSIVHTALASHQTEEIISALTACLGRGPGLTPAGDDLALGFLLALNRWGDRLYPNLSAAPINRALIDAARRNTTALSASLIECAARGQASERLVAALDGLVSGNLEENLIVENLLGWGHTSGAAAFQGMKLVLIWDR